MGEMQTPPDGSPRPLRGPQGRAQLLPASHLPAKPQRSPQPPAPSPPGPRLPPGCLWYQGRALSRAPKATRGRSQSGSAVGFGRGLSQRCPQGRGLWSGEGGGGERMSEPRRDRESRGGGKEDSEEEGRRAEVTRSRWRERQGCRGTISADAVRGTPGDGEREGEDRRRETLWPPAPPPHLRAPGGRPDEAGAPALGAKQPAWSICLPSPSLILPCPGQPVGVQRMCGSVYAVLSGGCVPFPFFCL